MTSTDHRSQIISHFNSHNRDRLLHLSEHEAKTFAVFNGPFQLVVLSTNILNSTDDLKHIFDLILSICSSLFDIISVPCGPIKLGASFIFFQPTSKPNSKRYASVVWDGFCDFLAFYPRKRMFTCFYFDWNC